MPISIRNVEAENLAREVAKQSGENLTQAIIVSLSERLERLKGKRTVDNLEQEIIKISQRCKNLPDLDPRSPDEILEYNDLGIAQ